MLSSSFEEEYKPTIGVDVHTMNVRTVSLPFQKLQSYS